MLPRPAERCHRYRSSIDSDRPLFHSSDIIGETAGEQAPPIATESSLPVRQEVLRIPRHAALASVVSRRDFCRIVAGAFAGLVSLDHVGEAADALPAGNGGVKAKTGSLVIGGGGRMTPEILGKFVELAGGKKAKIVIIPTASRDADDPAHDALSYWHGEEGDASFEILHTRNRDDANDPAFVRALQEATGVWISGGDQSRLIEAYEGTLVEKELRNLLARGGVIGGTSAGAAVMSEVMIKGGKTEARVGTGFGFLPPEIVIDQHLNKGRLARLLGVVKSHVGRIGIGIEEKTAIVVEGNIVTVVGSAAVKICKVLSGGEVDVEEFKNGDRFDMQSQVASLNIAQRR